MAAKDGPLRKLYLHVGTHKTGTKSFQAWLLDNRVRLAREGVAVATETSPAFGEVTNCFAFANAVLRPSLMTQARMTGHARPAGFWELARTRAHLRRFLATPGADRFVLSAEALCFAREEAERARLRRLLVARDIEVIPVVCLRDPDGWRASWAAYLAATAARHILPHGVGTDDIRADWVFDAPAIRSFWDAVGPLRVVDYDAATASDGTVLPALLRALDFAPDAQAASYFLNTRAA